MDAARAVGTRPDDAAAGAAGAPDPVADLAAATAALERALTAATLLAVDPDGLKGIHVKAGAGPVRDAVLAHYRRLAPADAPLRRCPAQIGADRLIGGLDLAATLRLHRPVLEQGLLASADGGAVVLAMAERAAREAVGIVADVLDRRMVRVERDGLAAVAPARFCVLALDEAGADEAGLSPVLADRLAFRVDLDRVRPGLVEDVDWSDVDPEAVAAARARVGAVALAEDTVEALVAAADAFGVGSLRTPQLAVAAARAAAALAGRDTVSREDAELAAALVIAPRATRVPPPPADDDAREGAEDEAPDDGTDDPPPEEASGEDAPDDGAEPPPPPPDPAERPEEDREERAEDADLAEILVEAVRVAMPDGLAEAIAAGAALREAARGQGPAGHAGADSWSAVRGRPAGTRRAAPRGGNRLSLIDTLRAAAPWQPLRRRERAELPPTVVHAALPGEAPESAVRVDVRPDDFRVKRFRAPRETLTVFVVDASGSSARARLAEAKGTVERLLSQAYARRDHVALVAFRGQGAELLLPPTRSLARAKRSLRALPGGGGTPVAAGLSAASRIAEEARRRGQTPTLVVLTDGRANVAADGTGGRERARADAERAARAIAADGLRAILVDVSPRPQPAAESLARAMTAAYVPLPRADSARIAAAVDAARTGLRA